MSTAPTPKPVPGGLALFDQLRRDDAVMALVADADKAVAAMGFTDHGRRHVNLVAVNAARVLSELGHADADCDLAAVAGLLHDIGNVAGREGHAAAGAAMSYDLLRTRGVSHDAAATVRDAIANHDEIEGGSPRSAPGAALIVADKADIHRSRVRTRDPQAFDIHDRVNFAVVKSRLHVWSADRRIDLVLAVDDAVATGAEVAELFELRFAMSGLAANFLGCSYAIAINGRSSLQGGGTALGE